MAGNAIAQDSIGTKDGNEWTLAQNQKKYGCREAKVQHRRPTNQCGINIFEPPKEDDVPYTGFKIDWGAAFAQSFQMLRHRNTAVPVIVGGTNVNQLVQIGSGFNLAGGNLYLGAQLADGVRVELTTYLSSRHHEDTWVKDGYVLIDKAPINLGPLNFLWSKFITLKVGHFEINYGDAHFRRSDNGMGMYNPFIGNLILDAFTTEIGGEMYLRANGFLAMGSITGGEVKGNVLNPQARHPAFISKIGFDRQVKPNLRVRLTGSNYIVRKSAANSLYFGDRAGSPYFFVLENTAADVSNNAWSGEINPLFGRRVTAWQANPFVKYRNLEFFGVAEKATGLNGTETALRTWHQYATEGVYRFCNDKLYVGARYNWARGQLSGIPDRVTVNRKQFAVGWFIIPYLEMKGEYVIENYKDFPPTDIRSGGQFHGPIVQAVLAF